MNNYEDFIQHPVAPRSVWRRPWLVFLLLSLLFASVLLVWLDPFEFFMADNERVPGPAEEIRDQAIRVVDPDRSRITATLKLPDGGVLQFIYSPISDSGVHLQRLADDGEAILWQRDCPPLYTLHSEYYHEVFVHLEGQTVKVTSRGSHGTFVERLDLDWGKRLARSVRKNGK